MNSLRKQDWPDLLKTEEQLDELLTRPSPALVKFIPTLSSPLIVLGAGGKMGPTLAWLAKRAADEADFPLEVIAVSRFSDSKAQAWLEARGIKTIACDLLEAAAINRLPPSTNIVYLVGLKFGTEQNPAATWAMNTLVPGRVAERYPKARIVALSTGNVYPLNPVEQGGSLESDARTPLGEYPNAAVGRERIFEFLSQRQRTSIALLRLFYAVELRYGVLVDIARKINAGEALELANGYFNCIWQGDANDMTLRAFALANSPPSVWNLCRPEIFSVRAIATQLGELLGRRPQFVGTEASTALLGNASALCAKLGPPSLPLENHLRWIAHWVKEGGRDLGRPTHFEVRDGRY